MSFGKYPIKRSRENVNTKGNIMKNIFKREYYFDPMVQFDEEHKPCICGISVLWLHPIMVKGFFYKSAEKKAFKILEENTLNMESIYRYEKFNQKV